MDANLPVTIRTVRTTVNASIDCKLSNRLFEFGTFPLHASAEAIHGLKANKQMLASWRQFDVWTPRPWTSEHNFPRSNRVSLCSDMKPRENLIQIRSLSAEASKLEISSEERREYSVSRYGRPYSGVRLVKLLGNSIRITSLKSLHHVRTKTAA